MSGVESRREIAANIVIEWADAHQVTEVGPGTKSRLITAIEAALKERDERAAKIAETAFEEFQTGYNAGKWIAAAIRNEDINADADSYRRATRADTNQRSNQFR